MSQSENDGLSSFIITNEKRFEAEALVTCEGCDRQNPPDRSSCLYCGRRLSTVASDLSSIKPSRREIDEAEKAFIIAGSLNGKVREAATLFDIEAEQLDAAGASASVLPFGRFADRGEAEIFVGRAIGRDISCRVIAEKDLDGERPPVRLRSISFMPKGIAVTEFNTGDVWRFHADDIRAVVLGQIELGRASSRSPHKSKDKSSYDNAEATSDFAVMDVHVSGESFRVMAAGFDFSCLGDEMNLLAANNIVSLGRRIASLSSGCRLCDDHHKIKKLLAHTWPVSVRAEADGLSRRKLGQVMLGKTVHTSNDVQFTRFSRLQYLFYDI